MSNDPETGHPFNLISLGELQERMNRAVDAHNKRIRTERPRTPSRAVNSPIAFVDPRKERDRAADTEGPGKT
jgi:hypothetical protein